MCFTQCKIVNILNLHTRRYLLTMYFLSASTSEAHASRNHFFFSPDFNELWPSVTSICSLKWQWATLVLGWVTVLVYYVCLCMIVLRLALVDRNLFWPLFCHIKILFQKNTSKYEKLIFSSKFEPNFMILNVTKV